MATHSSILARRIPWTEPSRLQSVVSQRVRHDRAHIHHLRENMFPDCTQPPAPHLQVLALTPAPRGQGGSASALSNREEGFAGLEWIAYALSSLVCLIPMCL